MTGTLCELCPRRCNADRSAGYGFCGSPEDPVVARAAIHYWEEPCISGDRGSGTVFFSGCTLRCVYCQNREISRGEAGKRITEERLCEIFLELQAKGAHNINLVTPDHYARVIARCVPEARKKGLTIPVIANTGGYVSREIFELMDPVVDIWLTDMKYSDPRLAGLYSKAPDYPDVARKALDMMTGSKGAPVYDGDGMMMSGVIVRILLLPGYAEDAQQTVKYIWERYRDSVVLSLMNQYTPPAEGVPGHPELNRTVTAEEYDALCDFALDLGIEEAFVQEEGTQEESFIPPFDLEGVEHA